MNCRHLESKFSEDLARISENCFLDKRREVTPEVFLENIKKLGLLRRIEEAKSIVIKPNFAGGSTVALDSHAVTDVQFLRQVVDGIRLINSTVMIYVAESDSAGNGYAFLKFSNLGLDKWQFPKVELLDLSRDRLKQVELPDAKYFKKDIEPLWLSEALLAADIVISLTNLKTHGITKYSGACKNLFGLLPRGDKYIYHTSVDEVIHDVLKVVKPQLSIVDGFRGMEQNGPIIGGPVDFGLRIWSPDAVTADLVACHMIGINYKRIKYLVLLTSPNLQFKTENIPIIKIRYRVPFLAFFNYVGLKIQRIGHGIYMYGHRIHSAYSFSLFMMMSLRPILLLFFDLKTLKRLKRKLFR